MVGCMTTSSPRTNARSPEKYWDNGGQPEQNLIDVHIYFSLKTQRKVRRKSSLHSACLIRAYRLLELTAHYLGFKSKVYSIKTIPRNRCKVAQYADI